MINVDVICHVVRSSLLPHLLLVFLSYLFCYNVWLFYLVH